ncbi:unnamed protein product [Knipowitschia caucasica]
MATTQDSVLREFCPLYYLLNTIPTKVQRGFRSVLVYLTSVDCSPDFVAVGSSIGMLYLYCRRQGHMTKYSIEGKTDSLTAVKLLTCFDDLVAVGTASGRVAVFQLVSPLPGRNKQLRRFDVQGLHRGPVTALAWSTNGMKLFSGDDNGRVVFTTLDLDQGECRSVLILEESSAVVQIQYRHQVLLVSTLHRTLLHHQGPDQVQNQVQTSQNQATKTVGTQPRKSSGRFGACFLPSLCKQSDLQIFAARPGLRLWRSNVEGDIQETRLLKALFGSQVPQVALFPRPSLSGGCSPSEKQLGALCCFHQNWLLSWNEYSLYVLDYSTQELVGVLESSGDLVSVSCSENEIFLLKGDRDIIRLSTTPEGVPHSSDYSGRLTSPLTTPLTPTFMPPTGAVETAQSIRTLPIITEGGHQGDEETGEEAREEVELPSRSRSSSVASSVTSHDSPRFCAPIGQEQPELVVTAVKLKRRRRRRRDSGTGQSEDSCSESHFPLDDGGSDRLSLCGLDQNQNQSESSLQQPPDSLPLIQPEPGPDLDPVPQTPDVDLLLECTFSYQQRQNQDNPSDQNCLQDPFLSPESGPDPNQKEPTTEDQMFFSTLSVLDRKPSVSSDDEDIYTRVPPVRHEDTLSPPSNQQPEPVDQSEQREKPKESLSDSWMCYSGPGSGILRLQATDRYLWCLDFKGGLFFSPLSEPGLNWQRFDDNVHQVALSPSGSLLWKVEQRSLVAMACAKASVKGAGQSPVKGAVPSSVKGRRHWYQALEQSVYVDLSEDSAWIIRTNGDLYLQTGLSPDRPCARSVKVETPGVFVQVCVGGGVVWALTEHKAVFYREGVDSLCSEGERWLQDTVSEAQGVEPVCLSLGPGLVWALDSDGRLWFRTGISPSRPQGTDDHWWEVRIWDYAALDQGSLFQSLWSGAGLGSGLGVRGGPVDRVVSFLSQSSQVQPDLICSGLSGVWVGSGRNRIHHHHSGRLTGTFWQNVVPRGTVSSTKWSFIASSAVHPPSSGSFLWLAQSRRDLFCVWDKDGDLRPSSVPLPAEVELCHLSACRDALWALDSHGRVLIRTLTQSCPSGLTWSMLDLSQLGGVRLVSVSCGSQNVWALDSRGQVYFRVGTQALNPSMMLPAWICIEPPVLPVGVLLVQIVNSPSDRWLWALDNRGAVFVRSGLSDEMPVGTAWDHVPGLQVSQILLGLDSVWVRCVNGDVARRIGVSQRNCAGDYWRRSPGTCSCLTVTPGDELWAVTPNGLLSRRLTKLLPQSPDLAPSTIRGPAHSITSLSGDDGDDEWELI